MQSLNLTIKEPPHMLNLASVIHPRTLPYKLKNRLCQSSVGINPANPTSSAQNLACQIIYRTDKYCVYIMNQVSQNMIQNATLHVHDYWHLPFTQESIVYIYTYIDVFS